MQQRTLSASGSRWSLLLALGLCALGVALPACHDDDPCDPGQVYENAACVPVKNTGTGGSSGDPQPSGGAGGGGAEETYFGKACTTAEQCGGDAPICAAPQLPVCTQVLCDTGEINEGACPADWTCINAAPNPSACVKF